MRFPTVPDKIHKDHGWRGLGHWLGTGTGNQSSKAKKAQFPPFTEALRVARQLRLVSQKKWLLWCRSGARPANVPAAPSKVYVHDGWMGQEHWLCHANLDAATAPDAGHDLAANVRHHRQAARRRATTQPIPPRAS